MDPKRRRQTIIRTVVTPAISEQRSHHRNLNEQITSRYGEEILDEVRKIERTTLNIVQKLPEEPQC